MGAVRPANRLVSGPAIVVYLALVKILLHFAANGQYGYHGDELYFMACGEHLDFGYVDHAPLIAVVTKVSRMLLGDSLFALRFFPAVAGALTVILTGLIVRELGGGRFAQGLAAVTIIIAPAYLRAGNMLCIPAFEPLFWTLASYIVIIIVRRDRPRLWLLVGLVAGLGLLNKHTMLLWGFGLVVGLVLTPARRYFASRWLWLGGLIAFVVFLPNLVWQFQHDWPTLQFIRVLNRQVMSRISLLEFGLGQALYIHPANVPIWLAGLAFFLLSKRAKPLRLFAWSFLALVALLIFIKSKIYYLSAAYPILLAGGVFAIDEFLRRRRSRWLRPALATGLGLAGVAFVPIGLPVLSLARYERYVQTLTGGVLDDIHEVTQDYYGMHGWEDQVASVARLYHSLPPEEQSRCCIWAANYAEAGAIDFFGRRHGLPKAICGHMSYHLWGPGHCTAEVTLALGVSVDWLEEFFAQVTRVGFIHSKIAYPWETDVPVYICRKPRMPIGQFWPRIRSH